MRAKPSIAPSILPVSGRALWQALGFANERAFQRARQANQVQIPLYPLPGQARGVYARSDDLARYLASLNPLPPDRSTAP
jgi:hypothetical protein